MSPDPNEDAGIPPVRFGGRRHRNQLTLPIRLYAISNRQDRSSSANTGVICETWASQVAVIPAKSGIQSANPRKPAQGQNSAPDNYFTLGFEPSEATPHPAPSGW